MLLKILTHQDSLKILDFCTQETKTSYTVGMNDFGLMVMGMLGIIVYCLKKAKELQNKGMNITPLQLIKTEWYSIASSVCLLIAAWMLKKEAMQVEYATHFIGFCFFVIGYAGQNVFYALLGKVEKVTGLHIDDENKNLDEDKK